MLRQFTANQLGGSFSWSSSNAPAVPDGGTTAALFGLAIVTMGAAARRTRRV
jgi:hypothetical protein